MENKEQAEAILDRINIALNEIRRDRVKLLRLRGWELTSNYPDHVWRWHKNINGRTLAISEADALTLEEDAIEAAREAARDDA